MKKRQVTKMSLNELAKKMPVVSELQKCEFLGGTVFYDCNGNRLGELYDGFGAQIRVCNLDEYNDLAYGGAPLDDSGMTGITPSSSGLTSCGIALKDANPNVQSLIYDEIADQYAPHNKIIGIITGVSYSMQTSTRDYSITVDTSKTNPNNFDETMVISEFVHEETHLIQADKINSKSPEYSKFFSPDFSEIIDQIGLSKYVQKEAYAKQIADSSFGATPGWYQSGIIQQYNLVK